MKLNFATALSTFIFTLAFFISCAMGGETLVDQKFDSFNLSAPPAGWAVTFPTMLSIVPEDGHNVLKISNKGGKSPHVMVTLDPAKVAGKTLFFLASAKLPGAFKLIDGKPLAVPKMLIEILGEEGKPPIYESVPIAQGKPDWQKLEKLMAIPADATSVTAQVCVPQVDCEVFFDSFSIAVVSSSRPAAAAAPVAAKLPNPPLTPDTSPTITPPAAVANATKPATPAPAAPTPPAPATPTPPAPTPPPAAPAMAPAAPAMAAPKPAPVMPAANLAANGYNKPAPSGPIDPNSTAGKSPKKTLDDGGMTFGPDYAARLQKTYPSKVVTVGTALFIGPGFSDKNLLPKFTSSWRALPTVPKLNASTSTPRAMLTILSETLIKDKPEVVFIALDPAAGRKPTSSESEDWEDVARLCARFGALPVLVPNGADSKDEQYDSIIKAFKKAAELNDLLMVSSSPAEAFPKRAETMLKLLDVHVFARVKMTEGGKAGGPGGKPLDE